jgi:menaquinone-9 beta-reductase
VRRKITIAGGGLAGLTLGLLLRRDGVPVEIWDAGSYPRHRVCGEFISGRGLKILEDLSVPGLAALGLRAGSVQFFYSDWSSAPLALPEPALSIDRATLDHALASEFRRIGGVLHENRRWTGAFVGEGWVRATGRRPAAEGDKQFVGFKVHARDLPLSADLELHFSNEAYVGLSRLRDGTANVCGLFRKSGSFKNFDLRNGDVFHQVLSAATRGRFASARLNSDSFSAVAGISLKRETSRHTKECRIGDTICMIPPLTGNGMSVALESASLAAPFLRDYSEGHTAWTETRHGISRTCDNRFRRRLFSASLLQKIAFTALGRRSMMYFLKTVPQCFTLWFRLTR